MFEVTLRLALVRISSAVLVQTNGWQRSFQASMKVSMAAMRSLTEVNVPRRIAWRVMIPKNTETRFSHDPEVGVKCIRTRGCLGQPSLNGRVFVGGVVVGHNMQRHPRIGLGDLFEERQELGVVSSRMAPVGDLAGRHLQGREQGGSAMAHVVVGGFLGQPGADRQDRRGPVQRL